MFNPYPNSWYVTQRCAVGDGLWLPLVGSVGRRDYARGYLAALESFYPHPEYRLISAKGEIAEVVPAVGAPRVNAG